MKRKLSFVIAAAIMVCLGFLSSCGSTSVPSPQEVMDKINSGEDLETVDYAVMLEYLDEFVEMGEMSDGSYESGQEAGRRFPFFMTFANALNRAPSDIQQDEDYIDVMTRYYIIMQN